MNGHDTRECPTKWSGQWKNKCMPPWVTAEMRSLQRVLVGWIISSAPTTSIFPVLCSLSVSQYHTDAMAPVQQKKKKWLEIQTFYRNICRGKRRTLSFGESNFSLISTSAVHTNPFYTGQQATNLAVLLAARSADLDRVNWGSVLVQTRKQLITSVSPSLHPRTSRWATGKPLRSGRC